MWPYNYVVPPNIKSHIKADVSAGFGTTFLVVILFSGTSRTRDMQYGISYMELKRIDSEKCGIDSKNHYSGVAVVVGVRGSHGYSIFSVISLRNLYLKREIFVNLNV